MNEHDAVRQKLPLTAAGVLAPEELREVQQHVQHCEACRQEMELWTILSSGLKRMPQPAVPAGLVERTQARVLQAHAAAPPSRTNESLLIALAVFGWALSVTFWMIVGIFTQGAGGILPDGSLRDALTWSLASSVFVWITAGSAAVLMKGRLVRRTL